MARCDAGSICFSVCLSVRPCLSVVVYSNVIDFGLQRPYSYKVRITRTARQQDRLLTDGLTDMSWPITLYKLLLRTASRHAITGADNASRSRAKRISIPPPYFYDAMETVLIESHAVKDIARDWESMQRVLETSGPATKYCIRTLYSKHSKQST